MGTRRDSIERAAQTFRSYALEAGHGYTPSDLPNTLVELLTDLRLWAAQNNVDIELAVQLSAVYATQEQDTSLDEELAA